MNLVEKCKHCPGYEDCEFRDPSDDTCKFSKHLQKCHDFVFAGTDAPVVDLDIDKEIY